VSSVAAGDLRAPLGAKIYVKKAEREAKPGVQ
jgi:hypothetical protein